MHIYSTREMADILGTETWRIRRLFEDGTLPEPTRFAGKRAIPRELIPQIVDALRDRRWLRPDGEVETRRILARADGDLARKKLAKSVQNAGHACQDQCDGLANGSQ